MDMDDCLDEIDDLSAVSTLLLMHEDSSMSVLLTSSLIEVVVDSRSYFSSFIAKALPA